MAVYYQHMAGVRWQGTSYCVVAGLAPWLCAIRGPREYTRRCYYVGFNALYRLTEGRIMSGSLNLPTRPLRNEYTAQ